MANVLFSRDAVSLQSAEGTEGAVDTVTTQTSKAVVRHRCGKCWSPVFAELGPKRAVVPAALFSPLPPAWKPSHHIYYDSRVVDIPDGTPRSGEGATVVRRVATGVGHFTRLVPMYARN